MNVFCGTDTYILCAGMVSNALMMTTSGRVLSERLDVLRLTFYTAPVSCACLVPFYLTKEVSLWPCSDVRSWKGHVAPL